MKVVVATRNRGKLREIVPLLAGLKLDLATIDELAPDAELREDGVTFEENALAKARQAARATGLPAIADDSGLEVDALGGAPGVYSARYAGPDADDARNNAQAARGAPWPPGGAARGAIPLRRRLRRSFARARDRARRRLRRRDPRGAAGEATASATTRCFSFRPRAGTMAELPLEEKNRLSHRAAAFSALAAELARQPARPSG